MPEFEPYIGGNHIQDEEIERHLERLRSNRAVVVLPLNEDADAEPELKQCETIDAAFKEYQPSKEVSVKDEEGSTSNATVKFNKIKDFDLESLVDQVPEMRKQNTQLRIMEDLRNQLRENVRLRKVAEDPKKKQQLIDALKTLQQVLSAS